MIHKCSLRTTRLNVQEVYGLLEMQNIKHVLQEHTVFNLSCPFCDLQLFCFCSHFTDSNSIMESDYNDDYNYDNYTFNSSSLSNDANDSAHDADVMRVLLAVANVIIIVLGIAGNGLVIWIAGFKITKTVNSVWYLSLAVSDFLFCAFMPFSTVFSVMGYWVFGKFMCKFVSFILFFNMFSSIFLLVIISMDRCAVVMFPVWAQNMRTIRRALMMVLLAWFFSALLSIQPAIHRDTDTDENFKQICFYNYMNDMEHSVAVLCRFTFGFAIPLLIIIGCYVPIMLKLKNNQMAKSNKPFRVMTALIATFFISWIPYHFFNLLEITVKDASIIGPGQTFGVTLASANSFMNPLLYAFMGKEFKRKCSALVSKIENTFEEEARSTLQGTSITNSGEGRLTSAAF